MLSNLNEEYRNKLEIIKNHFGETHQKAKLWEELEEVADELWNLGGLSSRGMDVLLDDLKTRKKNVINLVSEFADCFVVAVQLEEECFTEEILKSLLTLYFEDDWSVYNYISYHMESEILEIAKQKIDRTLERIESGYYEPDICPNCGGDGGFENPFGGNFIDCNVCKGTGKVERKEK